MKKFILFSTMFIVFTMASFGNTGNSPDVNIVNSEQNRDTKIQVAILLDTSSSMDGLIAPVEYCEYTDYVKIQRADA